MFEFKKFFKSFFYKTSPYSQAGQDIFAYELFGNQGTYIDIGAGEPQRGNNCYMLEVQKKWKGFSVEFGDSNFKLREGLKNRWKNFPERKNKIYWEDAISLDYKKGLIDNNLTPYGKKITKLNQELEILKSQKNKKRAIQKVEKQIADLSKRNRDAKIFKNTQTEITDKVIKFMESQPAYIAAQGKKGLSTLQAQMQITKIKL